VGFYFRGEGDIPAALALFRRNHERIHGIVKRKRANPILKESSQTERENDH
jgi:hypothetical protein